MHWLASEDYVRPVGDRSVLTAKALAAMNAVPPALDQSRGTELVKASTQASTEEGKNRLIELVGTLFEKAAEGITKGMLGS